MNTVKLNTDLYEKLFIQHVNNVEHRKFIVNICLKHDPFVCFQTHPSFNKLLGYIHFTNSLVCTSAYQDLIKNKINVERPWNYVELPSNYHLVYSDTSPQYKLHSIN